MRHPFPPPTGLNDQTGSWLHVTGVHSQSVGIGALEGEELSEGDPLDPGSLIAEIMPGLYTETWVGVRFWVVSGTTLWRLTNGWWNVGTEGDEMVQAVQSYFAEGETDVLVPRTPENRRRDHTSASSAPRWLQCPASVQLADETAYPKTASFYAQEGTTAHELAESALRIGVDAREMIEMQPSTDVEASKEMAEHVQLYLDTVLGDLEDLDGLLLLENRTTASVTLCQSDNGERAGLGLAGTLDAAVWSEDQAHFRVYDLKYGAGHLVDVHENPQLLIYALGVWHSLRPKMSLSEWHKITLQIVVVQPRRTGRGEEIPVRRVQMTARSLQAWYEEHVLPAVKTFNTPDAEFAPSPDTCRWCPAAHACPALQQAGLDMAREVFGDDAPEDPGTALTRTPPSKKEIEAMVADLSPERIRAVLDAKETLNLFLKAVEKHAHTMLEHGDTVPGYKLVQKLGTRTWNVSDEEVVEHVIQHAAVDADALYRKPALRSPAQMEKLLAKDERGILIDLIHRPDRGSIIAPETDKRPALNVEPSAVFGPPSE